MLFNRSITTQFTIVFVVALLLVVGSFYLVLDSVYRNELKSQAETVADNVDAFGSWVSQYGRVWVRDDNKSYLGQVTLVAQSMGGWTCLGYALREPAKVRDSPAATS